MRDTIFISHATPEDNDFTLWLASRLELLGYRVWIDKKELLGGEPFWDVIELAIKNRAIKFLLVYSNNICYQDGERQVKVGIQKEIDFARATMQLNPGLKDFFTILHLDDSGYDLFPGAKDLNQIPFNKNWSAGLAQLEEKLRKDEIVKSNNPDTDAAKWYLNNYIEKNPIIERRELYYTNWWSIADGPTCFYILRYAKLSLAEKVAELNKDDVFVRDTNLITAFKKDFANKITDSFGDTFITPVEVFEIKIVDVINGYEKTNFPTAKDAQNHLTKLIKRSLHVYLKNNELLWYQMANKHLAYYHGHRSLPGGVIKFEYPHHIPKKYKRKQLSGKFGETERWNFALSFRTVFQPIFGFNLKSHLIFTESGLRPIDDKDVQHSYRRRKGKRMFNEEWRDLLMGFIRSLPDDKGNILLPTGTLKNVTMEFNPELFWSNLGYLDPKDLKRQEMFIDTREDEGDNLQEEDD
jgi:hypothetical protein